WRVRLSRCRTLRTAKNARARGEDWFRGGWARRGLTVTAWEAVPFLWSVVAFLSPLRGLFLYRLVSHGLRRGLHSFAAYAAGSCTVSVHRRRQDLVLRHTLKPGIDHSRVRHEWKLGPSRITAVAKRTPRGLTETARRAVPSLRDSRAWPNLTRHYRAGLSHPAATRLERARS